MKCPFCPGEVQVLREPRAVAHTVPPCQKYIEEDALLFLRNARLATVGPLPDDAEWPMPVPAQKLS